MQQPAIQVRNLRKSFRKRNGFRKKSELWAIDDVSFSVAQGETYGLLGPNGSGKSSLIRVLSTLLIADSGYVEMLGFTLPEQADEVRRIIGRVSVDAARGDEPWYAAKNQHRTRTHDQPAAVVA